MDSNSKRIAKEFPLFKIYDDGHVERTMIFDYARPTIDRQNKVESKDVIISLETGVKARVFKPIMNGPDQKLPLIVHYHGGGFCIGSALDTATHRYCTSLFPKLHVIVVSVDYRLAPEHPLPIAYEDSWAALQWVVAHSNNNGPDPWINAYVDFNQVFLLGESAGANIAHNMAVRAGVEGLDGVVPCGMIIVHPYFVGHPVDEMIGFLYPGCDILNDPKMNPDSDPNLGKMGCPKVLVCVAEKDELKPKGVNYCEILKNCGWKGGLEFMESKGEIHCFHMANPYSENAKALVKKFAMFIDQD